MSSSSVDIAPYQVWLAYVRFVDHPEVGKVRPVVIVDDETAAIVAAKVTSAEPSAQYQYYSLLDWEHEGLLRPSRVQLAPLLSLSQGDLLNDAPIGILSERDQIALRSLLEE